jgi:hypothetical protein
MLKCQVARKNWKAHLSFIIISVTVKLARAFQAWDEIISTGALRNRS